MTTRLDGLIIALDSDVREDDAEALIAAISQLRGVCGVVRKPVDPEAWFARQRVRFELADAFAKMHEEILGGSLDEIHRAAVDRAIDDYLDSEKGMISAWARFYSPSETP